MLNKLLIKILKKFKYVNGLENRGKQLEAVVERLQNEKSEAVVENKRQAYKLKQLESTVVNMIEEPHMIYADTSGNKYVFVDVEAVEKNEDKRIDMSLTFPLNKFKVLVSKR